MSVDFEPALKVADAVMYEGYVLYPYRASANKNHVRWQFGVLVPRGYGEDGANGESWFNQTECLAEPGEDARIHVRVRFLQAQAKLVEEALPEGGFRPVEFLEVEGRRHITWDEAVEREVDATASLSELLTAPAVERFEVEGSSEQEDLPGGRGRITRRRWPLAGDVVLSAEELEGPYGIVRLRVRVENATPWDGPGADRDEALRRSFLSAHTLLAISAGGFISLMDPPEWARPAVQSCTNVDTFPVLAGEPGRRDLMLSSRIILYDHPEIAKESDTEFFDATEIDEMLSLRTMTLTDEEKREARATDPRAAAIIDRVDAMPPELLERLHGTMRYFEAMTGGDSAARTIESIGGFAEPPAVAMPGPGEPWWDPGSDASVSPETDVVMIEGVPVSKGSRVRLHPRGSGTDAQDMFLDGRVGSVEAVLFDVDGNTHLAVTLEDDPAADLHAWYGRFRYFAPDEVEPLQEARP